MITYEFSPEFVGRFRAYLQSNEYGDIGAHSKSEYWEHHAKTVSVRISGNRICVDGRAGCYIPPQKGARGLLVRGLRAAGEPGACVARVKRKIGIQRSEIKLLDYFEAFDRVMAGDRLSNPELSPHRIDFRKIGGKPGAAASIEHMKKIYFARKKYTITPNIIHSYYFYNILNWHLDVTEKKRILEIGAGNGNLLSLLFNAAPGSQVIDVDLPETLSHAMVYIADLFPGAKIMMPHEFAARSCREADFVFLTPRQTRFIENDSVDLAVNISSFQEMTRAQIEEYFKLIQRCGKNGSYFLTSNRVEKIPGGPDVYEKETREPPNRFAEYPWHPGNRILVYEICRLCRLCQLEGMYIRLEQLKK